MLFVRLKVTCDGCGGREEVFDAPMDQMSRLNPPPPEGWSAKAPPPDSRDDFDGPEVPLFFCPPCTKKQS